MFSSSSKTAIARLNEFFFGPDKAPWTVIRIGCAFLILATLLLMGISGNYVRLYGHYGMLRRADAIDTVLWPGFLFLIDRDPSWIWRIYWVTVAAAVCLAIGLWTRVAAALTFFLYVAMVQRNLVSFNGETGILTFALFALIFAPSPQRFSVDHLLLKKPVPARPEIWATRFVQFNVCMMYLFTTLGKFAGQWDLGTGEIWYHITLSDWFRFSGAEWLRHPLVCWIVAHGSLLMEGGFAFLVWTELRLPLVLLLMMMHACIIVLFDNALTFFNIAAIIALCGFLETGDLHRIRRFVRGLTGLFGRDRSERTAATG
ncbi:MAG: HTTM domain-containing protein [Chthoniobacterales bacterium]